MLGFGTIDVADGRLGVREIRKINDVRARSAMAR